MIVTPQCLLGLVIVASIIVPSIAWSFPSGKTVTSSRSECSRRDVVFGPLLTAATTIAVPSLTSASNLPESTGADVSRVATVEALIPIVRLRQRLDQIDDAIQSRRLSEVNIDGSIPRNEKEFKRMFDEFSDPVSYKQRFLDQNAFLVYYTNGFDGPGRAKIENDINERQTQQFGLRNEAWIAWENFLTELRFVDDDDNDCQKYLLGTKRAVDDYLRLAPKNDLLAAQQALWQR